MMALICAIFPSHETAAISPVEEARNEAIDKRDVVEHGRIVMALVPGMLDGIRIEVTDRDRTNDEGGRGADQEMGK